ncbi:MAG: divalent-cation tolerance protein CutA [Candidatus Kerfeldbacteria bacterium]|jgi:periplasmic divalent cation tolerance protein
MIHVYIHYPSKREAKKISKILINKHLAGCVSFVNQEDIYWWQGKIVETKGVVTFIATKKSNYKKIEAEVKKYHSFKVPCILELPVNRAFKPYQDWLYAETNKRK